MPERTDAQLRTEISRDIRTNTNRDVSGNDVRDRALDIVDSKSHLGHGHDAITAAVDRLDIIEDDGWVTDTRLAQAVRDKLITPAQATAITSIADKADQSALDDEATTRENADSAHTSRLETIEDDGWVTAVRLAQAVQDRLITASQAQAIMDNSAKVGITSEQATAISTNSRKVGITPAQATAISTNSDKVGITPEQASAIRTISGKATLVEYANQAAAEAATVDATVIQWWPE